MKYYLNSIQLVVIIMMNNYDELIKKLKEYKEMNINEIDKDKISDISEINISRRKSSKQRILDFLNEIENPYFFKVADTVVQIGFSDDSNLTADDCLFNVLKDIYR